MTALARRKEGKVSFLEGGRGEPLLLLHGIPGSAYSWEAAGTLLAGHFRIIIPDLLGFGQSDMPEGDFYMEAQADATEQLLHNLDISSLHIAAHDFGGPVALTLVRLFPQLRLHSLVISASNLFTDTYIPPPLRAASVPLLGTLLFKAMAGNRIGLRLIYLAATREKTQATWHRFERHLTPSGVDFTRRIFQRSLADLETNYRAIEEMLPSITAPTLVLWGSGDPFFSVAVGQRARQAIPGAVLKVYEHTGHFVPEERPVLVASDISQFLRCTKDLVTALAGDLGA